MCERVVSIHGFSAWRGAEGGRSGASFRVCARLVVVVVVAATAACLRDAYPIKIARTRGVTRASRELRAFREANERSKKKALSADDRFTNVTSIRKIFGGAEKKGKNKEKFLKWFRRKKKRESRSGIGREGKVVEEVTILSLEKISRSNWTIVRSTGSRNFVLSSFVALGKRDGCSRFEKLFSTLKTGRERKENSIRYNKISTIIIIIIIKFHYLPYNMFQYRLIFILILKIIKTISFKITR